MSWEEAQQEELTFWTCQNYDLVPEYYDKRSFFVDFIESLGKSISTLDLGCGAIAQSFYHKLTNVTLCDSLIDAYIKLDDKHCNYKKHKKIVKAVAEDLPFKDRSFDIVLFTNILDHTKDPEKAFSEVVRVSNRYLLFYCDVRDHTDRGHIHLMPLSRILNNVNSNPVNVEQSVLKPSHENMCSYQAVLRRNG